jgi:hypothetical protein
MLEQEGDPLIARHFHRWYGRAVAPGNSQSRERRQGGDRKRRSRASVDEDSARVDLDLRAGRERKRHRHDQGGVRARRFPRPAPCVTDRLRLSAAERRQTSRGSAGAQHNSVIKAIHTGVVTAGEIPIRFNLKNPSRGIWPVVGALLARFRASEDHAAKNTAAISRAISLSFRRGFTRHVGGAARGSCSGGIPAHWRRRRIGSRANRSP